MGPCTRYWSPEFLWAEGFLDFSGKGYLVINAYAGDIKKDNVLILTHPSKPSKDFDEKSGLVTALWGSTWKVDFKGDEFYLNGKIFDLEPGKFYCLADGQKANLEKLASNK
jgi:hypothetical protein